MYYVIHFKVPEIPPTTNKTVRFPIDVVEEVEHVIKGRDCTFTAFVVAAVRSALEQVKADEAHHQPAARNTKEKG